MRTDSSFTKARIESIDDKRVRAELDAGRVVIITGFQGIDPNGHVTTLGRGGSDTSAVAVAAALKAAECLIYTDVDGVYTTDPRVVQAAKRLNTVSFEEMLEMASLGSRCCKSAPWNLPAQGAHACALQLHALGHRPGGRVHLRHADYF